MCLSDFLSGPPYDSRHYESESSGSRMRRMDYGRMEHDVGYAKPSRSASRKSHRSDTRAADHVPTATVTNRRPSLAQRLVRSSSHHAPESRRSSTRAVSHAAALAALTRGPSHSQRPIRSSSHYAPSPPIRSQSHRSRKLSTINPTTYYGYADCIGKGNPYASGISEHSSLLRRRNSAAVDRAWEAEQRERDEALGKAYGARTGAKRPSTAASEWTYDWGSEGSGAGGSRASGRRRRRSDR